MHPHLLLSNTSGPASLRACFLIRTSPSVCLSDVPTDKNQMLSPAEPSRWISRYGLVWNEMKNVFIIVIDQSIVSDNGFEICLVLGPAHTYKHVSGKIFETLGKQFGNCLRFSFMFANCLQTTENLKCFSSWRSGSRDVDRRRRRMY